MRIIVLLALATWSVAAQAQSAEALGVVPTFVKLCLGGGLDPAARPTALSAAGWTKDNMVTVDVPKLGISRAIERNYDFSKPERTEQWSGAIDGRPANVVLAAFPVKRPHRNLCALTIDGIKNATPYGGSLRDAFKTFGISGKSVDLVHYYEFAGKVGADKHRVRGEVFSRSLASGGNDSMHIYVAY